MPDEKVKSKVISLTERIDLLKGLINTYKGIGGKKKIGAEHAFDKFMQEVQGKDLGHFEEELLEILKPFILKTGVTDPSRIRKGLRVAIQYHFSLKSVRAKVEEWGLGQTENAASPAQSHSKNQEVQQRHEPSYKVNPGDKPEIKAQHSGNYLERLSSRTHNNPTI